jgi:hypothetical protein
MYHSYTYTMKCVKGDLCVINRPPFYAICDIRKDMKLKEILTKWSTNSFHKRKNIGHSVYNVLQP